MLLMHAGKKQSIDRQLIAIVFIKKYDNSLFFRVDQAIWWKDSTSSHTLFLVVSDSAVTPFSAAHQGLDHVRTKSLIKITFGELWRSSATADNGQQLMADQVWVLKILSGPHVGAEITLDIGQYSLGRHEECDLVLTDNTLADYQLEILVSADGVNIRNLAEGQSVYLNGQAQENQFAIQPFVIATAGSLHFAMAPEGATWPELAMPDLTGSAPESSRPPTEEAVHSSSFQEQRNGEDIPVLDDELSDDELMKLDRQRSSGSGSGSGSGFGFIKRRFDLSGLTGRLRTLLSTRGKKVVLTGGAVALLIGFISAFSWLWQLTDPVLAENEKPVPYIVEAENLRTLQNLEDITLKTLPDGSVLLAGYVVDDTTRQAYLDALAEQSIPFNNQIITLDEMQKNAMSTLEMHGYKSLTVSSDTLPGTLILRGYLHTARDLTRIRELLRQEVHGLRTIIDQIEFQDTRVRSLRSMLKEKALTQRIKLLDQPGKVVLKGRLIDISQGYQLKEVVRNFREKYGKRPELVVDVTLPAADLATLQPVINVKSVTIGRDPFVILDNGEKYLKGAKLKNGYILENITLEYLALRLGRERIKYYVGGNHSGS